MKKRCDLLRSSIVNAIGGKDTKLLSEDLKNSVGRLGVYVIFYSLNFGLLIQAILSLQRDMQYLGSCK